MNSNLKSNLCLILFGIQSACCFLIDASSGSGHDGGWSDWRCEQTKDNCFKIRTCTSTIHFNCPQNSELRLTTCPCVAATNSTSTTDIVPISTKSITLTTQIPFVIINTTTTIASVNSATQTTDELKSTSKQAASTTTGVHWLEWSDWECKTVNHICLMSRTRNCSTYTVDDCEIKLGGVYFNTELCRAEICTATQLSTQKQILTTSPTATKKLAALSNFYTATTSFNPTSMSSSASARFISATAPVYVTSQTAYVTNPASSYPLGTSKPIVAPSTPYIYWLEWTGWECKNVGICLMSRTRNCSTYITNDCERKLGGEHFHVEPCKKEICPVNWSEWSNWTCRVEKDGSCNKTRSRKCSTGSDAQCGSDTLQREPCDDVTCPELNELGQLGYCKGLDSSSCIDADACKHPNIRLMCLADSHVASKICPKACGCCHVDPEWSSWSDWRCERTKTMCRMKQNRTCSTGNTTDCEGISVREAVCDESLCPEPTWDSWSGWKCQLRPNNACIMSRYRTCSTGRLCIGQSHEEDVCSSAGCPDFVDFKVDCSLYNTKSDACVDGAGCHFFANSPKTLCVDNAAACPVTCGCCIPSILPGGITTPNPYGHGSIGTDSGVTTNNTIGITGSGGSINNPSMVTTRNPTGSGGNSSNGTGVTTNNPIGITTQNPTGFNVNGSFETGSGVTTNNPFGIATHNPSGSSEIGSNGETTNNPIGLTTQSTSGSWAIGSYGTGSGVITNNPLGTTTQNPSGSGVNGSIGTGSGVTTNNQIGITTQTTSWSGVNGSIGTGSGVTTNNQIGIITTQNPSGSSGIVSNGTGSGGNTNNPIGVTTQITSGSWAIGSNGTSSGVTSNNPLGITTQTTSGSGVDVSTGTGFGVTTNNNQICIITTQNPSGSSGIVSNGTSSGVITNNPLGITTQTTSGSGVNVSIGTGSGVTKNNQIGIITTHYPSGSSGIVSNGTGSGGTTNNPIGVTTQSTSGSWAIGSYGTGSGVTTNNLIGVTTQNPAGFLGNGSNGYTTNNPAGGSTQNPFGSGGNSNGNSPGAVTTNPAVGFSQSQSVSSVTGTKGTGSGLTTYKPLGVSTQNPPGAGGNVTIGTGSVNVTNSTSHTVASTPAPIITSPTTIKTTTTTQKQPHTATPTAGTRITTHVASAATATPTTAAIQALTTASTEATTATATTQNLPHTSPPVPVTCNVCSGPEFLCEKLFAPQTCSPPNNYCINKLSNHRDGTRLVTRNCGNFNTCYQDWFLASSDSDRCRIFDENSVITLEFDCTYCCTSDNCNKPIKPLAKDLYKNIE